MCKDIILLINDPDVPKLETLSQTTKVIPFVVAVPGKNCQLKVIYGLGAGCGLTGLMANDLGDNILALEGEIDPLFSIPIAHQLPKDALTPKSVKVPSMA